MYKLRSNVWPERPGLWITADGEYEFERIDGMWRVRHRASISNRPAVLGYTYKLTGALRMAAQHYMTPVGHWHNPSLCGQCAEASA